MLLPQGALALDDSLRKLERAFVEAPGDETAATAFLAALARATEAPDAPPDLGRLEGRPVHGPLLPGELERLRSLAPDLLIVDRKGNGWLAAEEPRGRALYAAALKLRLLEVERWAEDAPASFGSWFGLHAAIDALGEAAIERLVRVVAGEHGPAAERAARLLAARTDPAIGTRLARLARTLPAESRHRIYVALSEGRVPLDEAARDELRAAVARDLAPAQEAAYEAPRRGAKLPDLRKDYSDGSPAVRAQALKALVALVRTAEKEALVKEALTDPKPEVRLMAVRILEGPHWVRHPRSGEWVLGRLGDAENSVFVAAVKALRRVPLSPKQVPRLRLIVGRAPPGRRAALQRVLDHIERKLAH
jgi:hypothetical protein